MIAPARRELPYRSVTLAQLRTGKQVLQMNHTKMQWSPAGAQLCQALVTTTRLENPLPLLRRSFLTVWSGAAIRNLCTAQLAAA